MTQEFKILWFEDETTWYTMQSKKVEAYLEDHYNLTLGSKHEIGIDFEPNILTTENTYDLILMDYKLAAGNTGDKIIDLIRNNSILTDILLYSSEYQKMTTALMKGSPLIDGVYFADRKSLLFEEKLHNVIQKIVRRSEDIVNLRGSFLDNTSDFEIRIRELLKLSWDKFPEHQNELEKSINDVLDNILKHDTKVVTQLRNKEKIFPAANEHPYALSIRHRLTILNQIIKFLIEQGKIKLPDEYSDIKNFEESYSKEISVYRNALSHKKFSDTSIKINGKVIQIDQNLHLKLRKNIKKYELFISYLENCFESM